ncbi:hypothetical protein HKD37_08G023353 [Glycine soja]
MDGILEIVSNPWRFTVGIWLCDSDLVSPTRIERVLTEKDLLADSYSDLEASILDEKEFLLLKVISTLSELSCLICSMVGAGRGTNGVALSITHFLGRVISSHFIVLRRETNVQGILRNFWDVPVIHVLIYVFESDFLIEEIVFWGDLMGLVFMFIEQIVVFGLSDTSIVTIILCLNILSEQYTLVLLPFIIHGSYCYSIIQLKYQTIVLPENTVQTYTV